MPHSISIPTLFRIGALGYFVGFLSWLVWFVDFLSRWVAYSLRYSSTSWSGVVPAQWVYVVFFSLFAVSYIMSSFACFAFNSRFGSSEALAVGVFFLLVGGALLLSVLDVRFRFQVGYPSMALGHLVWGIVMMMLRKLPSTSFFAWVGLAFVMVGALGLIWLPVILLFGIGVWMAALGWLYALAAAATAVLLFRLSKRSMQLPNR